MTGPPTVSCPVASAPAQRETAANARIVEGASRASENATTYASLANGITARAPRRPHAPPEVGQVRGDPRATHSLQGGEGDADAGGRLPRGDLGGGA